MSKPLAGTPPVLILIEPQDIVNIGAAVRICCNFGVDEMRVIKPHIWDPYRIEGIAHHTGDFIARVRHFDTVQEALADCSYSVVLTGRERTAKRRIQRPREAAEELVARSFEGRVAIVAGREDSGLTNEELDACHTLVTIATDPRNTSLNMAQAIAVFLHEVFTARGADAIPFKRPKHRAPKAGHEILERMFNDWERSLWGIEFFKTRQADTVLRTFREILYRADLDDREAKLVRAMGIEVLRYLERNGAPVGEPPGGAQGRVGSGTPPRGLGTDSDMPLGTEPDLRPFPE